MLNVSSVFSENTLGIIPELPPRGSTEIIESTNVRGNLETLLCINVGKAAGKNGLLPKLLKCCDDSLLEYVCDLLVAVFLSRAVER